MATLGPRISVIRLMSSRSEAIRILLAAAGGFGAAMLVPIYSEPFSGCQDRSFVAEFAGCSHWPEVLRSTLFAAPLALVVRSPVVLSVTAAMLLCVALAGGIAGIQQGSHLEAFSRQGALAANLAAQWPGLIASALALTAGFTRNYARRSVAV